MLKAVGQQLEDGRWLAPSAERNREPILAELKRVLPNAGLVLEIASGTGEHVIHFASALPGLTWQPSDSDATFRRSIEAWIAKEAPANVRMPIDLDVRRLPWPVKRAQAVLCINCFTSRPGQRRKRCSMAQRASFRPAASCFFTVRTAGSAPTPPQATQHSMSSCARSIRNGDCAISKPWSNSRAPPDFVSATSSTCRETTSA
jgi:hypothetical protein